MAWCEKLDNAELAVIIEEFRLKLAGREILFTILLADHDQGEMRSWSNIPADARVHFLELALDSANGNDDTKQQEH